jgi:F0F1-type ATP synthase gamma subunit
VAAAKIRRAEIVQKQARPYADALSAMLKDLMAAVGSVVIRSSSRGPRVRRAVSFS